MKDLDIDQLIGELAEYPPTSVNHATAYYVLRQRAEEPTPRRGDIIPVLQAERQRVQTWAEEHPEKFDARERSLFFVRELYGWDIWRDLDISD